MNKIITTFLILLLMLFFWSCEQKIKSRPTNALETGRLFIRATLDGDTETAGQLILSDSANIELFGVYKKFCERMPEDKKQHYKKSNYQINNYIEADDSTTYINYSNDYMNKPTALKIVKKEKLWYVDFKYLYSLQNNLK